MRMPWISVPASFKIINVIVLLDSGSLNTVSSDVDRSIACSRDHECVKLKFSYFLFPGKFAIIFAVNKRPPVNGEKVRRFLFHVWPMKHQEPLPCGW